MKPPDARTMDKANAPYLMATLRPIVHEPIIRYMHDKVSYKVKMVNQKVKKYCAPEFSPTKKYKMDEKTSV
jgi:hypothetical protein